MTQIAAIVAHAWCACGPTSTSSPNRAAAVFADRHVRKNIRVDELRIEPVDADPTLHDWRHVHNVVIPTAPLSVEDVRERIRRNRLDVGYLGDVVIGCTTVRPPADDPATATIIARVLPEHRGRGFGTTLYAHGLARAKELGVTAVETVVLASNEDGLRFALRRGFTEIERYLLPGDTVPFVTLRRPIG